MYPCNSNMSHVMYPCHVFMSHSNSQGISFHLTCIHVTFHVFMSHSNSQVISFHMTCIHVTFIYLFIYETLTGRNKVNNIFRPYVPGTTVQRAQRGGHYYSLCSGGPGLDFVLLPETATSSVTYILLAAIANLRGSPSGA